VESAVSKILIGMIAGFMLLSAPLNAALIDKGSNGELFFDDVSGLYWYDPVTFAGWTVDELELFLSIHTLWKKAGVSEISALVCSLREMEPDGTSAACIMGAPTCRLEGIRSCWYGFIDPADGFAAAGMFLDEGPSASNVSMELYYRLEGFPMRDCSESEQGIPGAIVLGAWLYTQSDPLRQTAPVPEPSTLLLIGTGLIGAAGIMRKSGRVSSGHGR